MTPSLSRQLAALAAQAPLTPTGVHALAEHFGANDRDAVLEAAASCEPDAAAALLLALSTLGVNSPPQSVMPLLADVDGADTVIALVCCVDAERRVDMLLEVAEAGRMSWEREAQALFFAAAQVGDSDASPQLVRCLRTLARKPLSFEAGIVVGLSVVQLDVPNLTSVAGQWIVLGESPAGAQIRHRLTALLNGSAVDALPDTAAPHVVSGFTVRRTVPKVGRNEPCPCGSGRKYKKCCQAADAKRAADPSPVAGLTMEEYHANAYEHMSATEIAGLRPSSLAALEPEALQTGQLVQATRKLAYHRRWESAERMMQELTRRRDLPGGSTADEYREELIDEAIEAGARDVVQRQLALIEDAAELGLRIRLEVQLGDRPEVLKQLNEAALSDLRGVDPTASFELAWSLLRAVPGLGILVARGCIDPEHDLDSEMLLYGIEEARDRLDLPPNDPFWEVFDLLLDQQSLRSNEQEELHKSNAERDALRLEAGDLRRRARNATHEVAQLERQLDERQKQLERANERPTGSPDRGQIEPVDLDARAADKRTDLAKKIVDLKSLIREGNRDRAELRRQVADKRKKTSRHALDRSKDPDDATPETLDCHTTADGELTEATSEHEESVELDGAAVGVAIPIFERSAMRAITRVPRHVAAAALRLAGRLAAGDADAWRGVKRLKRSQQTWSARVGIRYRMLMQRDGDHLRVLDLIQRKDLETAIDRLV